MELGSAHARIEAGLCPTCGSDDTTRRSNPEKEGEWLYCTPCNVARTDCEVYVRLRMAEEDESFEEGEAVVEWYYTRGDERAAAHPCVGQTVWHRTGLPGSLKQVLL